MELIISGKHIDIGDALRSHIEEAVKSKITRYFEHAVHGHVVLSKIHASFHTDITVHESAKNNIVLKGTGESSDPYISVNDAIANVEKRLRKYNDKMNDLHRKQKSNHVFFEVTKRILDKEENERSEYEGDAPAIVSEKPLKVEKLSVRDAVMKMDLLSMNAMLFINSYTDAVNLLYYKDDGSIAWVETHLKA